uniref:Cytochrome P450 monooxygenase AKT7 ) n=1 Tax=Ganoderma boninense TaxID=34458 RepID=A0A5K1K9D7_9APHY|nr:Cytochrome P450 monooxygenase AKT7 (EC (AK-toxin biosynthesis protein 7) [Ganoderma boninense]
MASSSNGAAAPTSPLDLLPKIPHLDNTFGAVLIGTFIGLILYGITLHQSYRYFRMYPADSQILKCLVGFVLVLETISSALSMHVCYHYLVTNYFNPLALIGGEWSLNVSMSLSRVISPLALTGLCLKREFYSRALLWLLLRASSFAAYISVRDDHICIDDAGCTLMSCLPPVGRSYRYILAIAVVMCFVEMAATVEAFVIPTFEGFKHATWLVSTGSTMAVSSDILITAMLISALQRSRTGVKRTDSMLDVMIMYSINTVTEMRSNHRSDTLALFSPTISRIANLGSLLFAFIQPGTLIWAGVGIPGVKMYANTLMAALNSRRYIAEKGAGRLEDTSPFGISGLPDSEEMNAPHVRPQRTHRIEGWQVKTESTAQTDSVLDIVTSAPKGHFPENVPLDDIEKQG